MLVTTYRECISNLDNPDSFESRYGATGDEVLCLLDYNVLPENLLDIIVANSCNLLDKFQDVRYNTVETLKQFQELEHIGNRPDMGIVAGSSEGRPLEGTN